MWTIQEYVDGRWVAIETCDTEDEADRRLAQLRRTNPLAHYRKRQRGRLASAFSWWW